MDWNGVLVSSGHMAPLHLGHCRLAETQPSLHSCLALRLQTALRDCPPLWQPLRCSGHGAVLPGMRLLLTLSVLLSPPDFLLVLSYSADGLAPCFTEDRQPGTLPASVPLQQTHATASPLSQSRVSSSPRLTSRLPGFGCCLRGPFLFFSLARCQSPSQWNSSHLAFLPELFLEV